MALTEENKIINGLWVGNELSSIELLTLHSFTEHGHEFHLWVYESITNELPKNVILRDANEIIPASEIFRRKYDDPIYKIGKGSIGAPFSDLFRYKLLYEFGGWWVDMDVTCLQPFDIDSPYVFRSHPILPVIGNVMKVPPKSKLMKLTYEETKLNCDENTLEWLLPNKILNKHIFEQTLNLFIRDDMSTIDWWSKVEIFIKSNKTFPKSWFFIHWMNEEWRSKGIDKNKILDKTAIGNLCSKYDFKVFKYSIFNQLIYKLKNTFKK